MGACIVLHNHTKLKIHFTYIDMEDYMKFKKVLSLALVIGMMLAIPAANQNYVLNSWDGATVFIASQSGRDNAQEELDDVNDKLDDLEDDYSYIEGQLSQKAQALSDLLADKEILENDIHFPYQLKKGKASTRNAIKLLSVMGYSSDIIENAEKMAADFMRNGTWSSQLKFHE